KLTPLKWPARSSVIWLPVPPNSLLLVSFSAVPRGFSWQLMHEVLLNTGPMPSSNASTSENVPPVALISAWVQLPLLRPSKPVGASVTALTCGPWAGSSAWVATARPGSCAAGSLAVLSPDDEHATTNSEAGKIKMVARWRNRFMTVFSWGLQYDY